MLNLVRTNSTHPDFISLIRDLDAYLSITDGDDHAFYDQFNKVDKINTNTTDSIVDAIKKHSKYSVYSPKNNDYTLAWNNNNFIVYGLVENNYAQPKYTYDYSAEVDSAAVAYDEEYYEE